MPTLVTLPSLDFRGSLNLQPEVVSSEVKISVSSKSKMRVFSKFQANFASLLDPSEFFMSRQLMRMLAMVSSVGTLSVRMYLSPAMVSIKWSWKILPMPEVLFLRER